MADNLFKDSKCPIDSVPKADFNFLPLGCEITPAPKPIYGCTLPLVPRDPPTDVGRFCPDFRFATLAGAPTVKLDVGYGGTQEDADAGCVGPPSIRFEIVRKDVDPCTYEVDFELSIPIPKPPCPTINVNTFDVAVGYDGASCVTDKANIFAVTPRIIPGDCKTADQCEFDLDLSIVVPIPSPPCPMLYVNSVEVQTSFIGKDYAADGSPLDIKCLVDPIYKLDVPYSSANYTTRTLYYCRIGPFTGPTQWDTPDGIDCPCNYTCCVFSYDGDGEVTASTITPQIKSQTICEQTLQSPPGAPRGVWLAPDESCGSEVWQPPADCVIDSILYAFYAGSAGMTVSGEGVGGGTVSLAPVYPADPFNIGGWAIFGNTSEEGFLAATDVPYVPVSKGITAYNGTEITLTGNVTLTLEVTNAKVKETKLDITTVRTPGDCNNPETCEFYIDMAVISPIPRLPCPIITRRTFETTIGYAGDECLVGKETKFEITTKHTEPTNCNDPGQCEFDFDLSIVVPLPVPPCPVINSKTFEVISGFVGAASDTCIADNTSSLTITPTLIPNECNKPPACAFDFEVMVVVPIPRTPCPVINARSFAVTSGFADDECVLAENKFEITPTVIEPVDCNDPGGCQFDIDIAIGIPIPRIPCPAINVNTFDVTVGYDGTTDVLGKTCFGDKQTIFAVTPRIIPGDCNTPDQCEFDVDLSILIPIPKPPCPTINVTTFDVAVGYGDATDSAGTACFADKQNNFAITPRIIPGDCNTPDQCEFDVDLEIAVLLPKPPCPTINVTTFDVAVGYSDATSSGGASCFADKKNSFAITPRIIPGNCTTPDQCEFDVDLEIAVVFPRPPCPVINITAFEVATGYKGAECLVDKTNTFELTTRIIPGDCNTPDQCEFDFDLSIVVPFPVPPCPIINNKKFEVVSGFVGAASDTCIADQSSAFTITPTIVENDCDSAPECEFDFELSVVVPIPRTPCPVINAKSFKVTSGFSNDGCFDDAENKFEITTTVREPVDCNDPGGCQFDVDLEIAIPLPRQPCPAINVTTFGVVVGYGDAVDSGGASCFADKQNSFAITPRIIPGDCNNPDQCEFDVDLEIAVLLPKPPCPAINITTFEVATGYNGSECLDDKTNTFALTTRVIPGDCTTPDQCEFDFDLSIVVPFPVPPCPIINNKKFEVLSGFVGADNDTCITDQSSAFTITPTIVENDCSNAPECAFDFELSVVVPIPRTPCPTINARSFAVTSGFADDECVLAENKFEITPTVREPVDCTDPGGCQFDIDLAIAIPFPRPPCPTINVNTFDVTTGYAESSCLDDKENSFVITSRVIPGDCNTPEQCAFDVDLSILVPIPKPSCPTINVTTFNVATGYEDSSCIADKENKFTITPRIIPGDCNNSDQCEFDVELEIAVLIPQPPCPTINVNTFEVATGYAGSECVSGKTNTFTITPVVTETDCGAKDCSFDVDLVIAVPIPLPPCTEVKSGVVNVTTGFAGSSCLSGKENKLTCGVVRVPAIGCDQPEKCTFTIDLDIVVPVPAPRCPNITGFGSFNTRYSDMPAARGGSFLNVISTKSSPTCSDPGTCNTYIDVNVDTPIPRPPCPIFTVTQQKLKVGYEEENLLTFEVLPLHQLNIGTPNPPQCRFDAKLDIHVQIPRPPCTVVTASLNLTELPANSTPIGSVDPTYNYVPGESCEVDLAINLALPKQCIPSISGNAGATFASKDQTSTATIFVAQTGECTWEITPYISVKAITECPEYSGEYNVETSGGGGGGGGGSYTSETYYPISGGSMSIAPSGNGECSYKASVSTKVNGLRGGTVKVTGGSEEIGTGWVEIKNNEINVNVQLTTTECPADGGGGAGTKGDEGQRGKQGDQGIQGIQGIDGPRGFVGPMGLAGPRGEIGPTGATGVSIEGPAGPTGPMGIAIAIGLPGASGPTGLIGETGVTGLTGCRGPAGETGATGTAGPVGSVGPAGVTGPQGPSGLQGDSGLQGEIGPVGPTGLQGIRGERGASGATGPQGTTGPRGATGPSGVTGATGVTGPQGTTGPRGATGPRGEKGDTGAEGSIGPQGPIGPMGSDGVQGPRGFSGSTGPVGPSGPIGPQGLKGDRGSTGAAGATGPQGITGLRGATGLRGEKGDTGTSGAIGLQGPTGPIGSAGVAGPRGFTGSAGPVGPSGPIGPQGLKGDRGSTGPAGPAGATGVQGAKGVTGARGESGPQGATGPRGATGVTGATGAAGPTGPLGQTGPRGTTGLRGPQGATGPEGATGPQGITGPTGAGATGPSGPSGPTGATGPKGARGTIGPRGITGATGVAGPQGFRGAAGTNGVDGSPGLRGINGATGATGVKGPTGPTGPCGVPGDIGATGVRGASGATGPQGITGAIGPTGPRGITGVTGSRGVTGSTGPRGATGPQAVIFGSTFVSSKPNILNGTITITDENVIGADVTLNTTTLAADADFFNSFLAQIGLDSNGNPVNSLLRAKLKLILQDLLG